MPDLRRQKLTTLTFGRVADAALIRGLVRRAWDRPAMLCEGASLDRIPILDSAQYFVVRDEGRAIALFIGFQVSPVCIDLHVCLTPECRGRRAIEVLKAFFSWLATSTPYRKAIGSIPAYNKPMLFVALRAGTTILGVNGQATMRNGKLEDLVIVERRLA